MQTVQRTLSDLVSVAEAAKFLGVGRKVIYQLIDFGELRAIRKAGKIFIDPCSIHEFFDKGKMA